MEKIGRNEMGKAGLKLINAISRHIFRQNTTAPCPTHFTSQVIDGDRIHIMWGLENRTVIKSFAQSGNCYYRAKNGIVLQPGTYWGPGVKMISADHGVTGEWIRVPHIHIGENCWIGANAIILPGVELGDGVIVGAGSVVTKNFPDEVTIAGNPAKVIG